MAFLEVAGGALIGGGVSLATTLFVESRREKAERGRDEQTLNREILRAMRLIESECSSNRASLVVIRERDPEHWYPPSLPMIKTAWESYGPELALHPDPDLWREVDGFYDRIWTAEQTNKGSDEEAAIRLENMEGDCGAADRVVDRLRAAIAEQSDRNRPDR
jgi:hypothetical protein